MQVIWNEAMRREMLKFLDSTQHTLHQHHAVPAGAAVAAADSGSVSQLLSGFRHSSLSGELVVGGVFVRVYCSRPTELPPDAPAFCKALVRWARVH